MVLISPAPAAGPGVWVLTEMAMGTVEVPAEPLGRTPPPLNAGVTPAVAVSVPLAAEVLFSVAVAVAGFGTPVVAGEMVEVLLGPSGGFRAALARDIDSRHPTRSREYLVSMINSSLDIRPYSIDSKFVISPYYKNTH